MAKFVKNPDGGIHSVADDFEAPASWGEKAKHWFELTVDEARSLLPHLFGEKDPAVEAPAEPVAEAEAEPDPEPEPEIPVTVADAAPAEAPDPAVEPAVAVEAASAESAPGAPVAETPAAPADGGAA